MDGLTWRKSSASNPNGACVEVASGQGAVYVRDSTNRSGPVLKISFQGWRELVKTHAGH